MNANVVRVKQGQRVGTGMVVARHRQKTVTVKKTVELLQQFNGLLCFGKHSLISVQFIERPPKRKNNLSLYLKMIGDIEMKMSVCKNYDDLPLFLNANLVAQVLGVSNSTTYEVMHGPSFPTLRVGGRMMVPKERCRHLKVQHSVQLRAVHLVLCEALPGRQDRLQGHTAGH